KPFIFSLFFLFTAVLLLVKRIKLNLHDSLILSGLSIFTAVFTTASVIGSGFYSMAIIPPERTLFVAIYMIFICFIFFSFALASLIRSNPKIVWTLVMINLISSFILIKSVITHWSVVYKEVKTYATEWGIVEKDLPYTKDIVMIKNVIPVGGLDSFTDNNGWVAGCVAGYYNLKDVKIAK
ncbi:MAG: hypothetical protein NT162_00035, partial [Candidatus Woesebacteria bacterium]|nr:hypothetical protein [Candidatus Woesebacteria bacterium]